MTFKTKRDFSKVPHYEKRKMFLDNAGPVTIQRYDEYAYPVLADFSKTQLGFFWRPEEISVLPDKLDFQRSPPSISHTYISNLLRQTTLDSELGRTPMMIFSPVISVPELEKLVKTWTFFEEIHSESYSHIIRNVFNKPTEEFNKIHSNVNIVNMAEDINSYFNNLHLLNSQLVLSQENPSLNIPSPSEHDHIKAIYLALIAAYGLEAIRFTVSFATSFAMVENGIFVGTGNIIQLIMADEMLHTDFTRYMLNILPKNDKRFKEVAHELKHEVKDILLSVIDDEKNWAKYLFKEGPIMGLNEKVLCDLVDWTAQYRLKDIGIKYDAKIKQTPTPWFSKYFRSNGIQKALQETESTSYVMSSMSRDLDLSQLPKL